jgi:F-type H+-transporting ATPase subunit epsilon
MRVQIVTPDASFFDGEAGLVVLPGASGEFGVLPGHAPLISALGHGIARVLDKVDGKVLSQVAIYGGFAKAQSPTGKGKDLLVTVLAGGAAAKPDAPDLEAARKAVDETRAEVRKLREEKAAKADFDAAEERFKRAQTFLTLVS